MLTFNSIGYSTEDLQVFSKFVVDFSQFPMHERFCILEGAEYLIEKSDWKNQLDILEKDGFEQNVGDSDYDLEWKSTVDKFRELLDTEGFLFQWGVEYDANLFFIQGMSKEELVDFLAKEMEKAEKEQDEQQ